VLSRPRPRRPAPAHLYFNVLSIPAVDLDSPFDSPAGLRCRGSVVRAFRPERDRSANQSKELREAGGFQRAVEERTIEMTYDAAMGMVIYRSKMHAGMKRNFQVMPGAEWLELLCKHIPDRYEHLVRYVGWYSNRARRVGSANRNCAGIDFLRSGQQSRESWKVKVLPPSIARFGRLAYPLLGEVTDRDMRGRKSHGCPVVGDRRWVVAMGVGLRARAKALGHPPNPTAATQGLTRRLRLRWERPGWRANPEA